MLSRKQLERACILAFITFVGYCLAQSIYLHSFIGGLCSVISLAASIYFIYLLAKAKREIENEEAM